MLIDVVAVAALQVSRFLTVLADHREAAGRFEALVSFCGWPTGACEGLEVTTADTLDAADHAAAQRLGASIKFVLWAACAGDRIEAFAGPALVPRQTALTSTGDDASEFQLAGSYASSTFTSDTGRHAIARLVSPPTSEWLLRLRFPGVTPHVDAASALVARVGLIAIAATADANTHWVRVARVSRICTENAIGTLRRLHRIDVNAIRAL